MDLRSGILQPKAPFSFKQAISYIRSFPASQNDHKIEAGKLIKTFRISNKTFGMQVINKGSIENPRLKLTILSKDQMSDTELEEAIQRVRFYLGIDDEVQKFYDIADEDTLFSPIINSLYGHHLVKFLTAFEAAVWALLNTNLTLTEAVKAKKRLQRNMGAMININGINFRSFPEPQDIIDAPDDELEETITQDRIRTRVYNLASFMADFSADDTLQQMNNDELKDHFLQLDGFEQGSSLFVLNFGLGRMDEIHCGDPRLVKAVEKTYGTHYDINRNTILEIASKYGQWKGYWAQYLKVNHKQSS